MKLMTLNILQGGMDEEHSSRIDFIIAVIREANPDFVAVQEAHNFEKNSRRFLRRISERIGLPYCDLSPGTPREFDKQSHVANFSRYRIKKGYKFPGCRISGGALLSVIDSPIGELAICNLHLDMYSEDFRLREVNEILKHTLPYENLVILGDFNSVSLDGDYDPKTIEVEYRFVVTNMLKRFLADAASNLGWEEGITFPTPINTHLAYTRPLRVDYIFVSPSLAVHTKNVAVIKTQDSEKASDHYPLVVTLGLE